MSPAPDDPLASARAALDRHEWDQAYATLSEADRQGSLGGEGLDLLAQAAYWSAHPEETVELLERAYGAYLKEGDQASAAMMAYRVAEQNGMRMAVPQAQGWAARAQRLAESNPEWPVHGWLQWMGGLMAWFEGDLEAAITQYDRCQEFGARTGDRDLEVISLHDKGHALCLLGRIDEGMPFLDEAMTAVVGGELTPHTAGYVYCGMIGACSKLGDYRRAAEWTDATLRWCERQSVPAFPGVCRIHTAELLRLRGSFAKAEQEARLACEELPRFNFYSGLGPANYEIGEIRRHVGDFQGAEAAYTDAQRFGFNPQPGLSLLRLAQGKFGPALEGIRHALSESGANRCLQVRLLAAQAEIALAAEDLDAAAGAVAALESVVPQYEAASLHAMLDGARGALRLAQGDAAEALANLRRAQETWRQIKAPREVAELSLLLARAHQALGNEDAAAMEARSARDSFERLGAVAAAGRAAELVEEVGPPGEPAERVTRSYMFTDIVKSTDLVGAIGDEAWENLLAWHDEALRSLFASHGGEVAHHTGDGFFVAFATPRSALACAVAIQRALAEHRRDHGFAPQVRIGLHTAEATRRGRDYSGGEVHKAARIAAAGEGGEILASGETVAGADGEFLVSDAREMELRGIAQPVRVARIEWRSRGAT